MLGKVPMSRNSTQSRCTEGDYRWLFSPSSDELYRLCFILTADDGLARASFATAMEHTLKHGSHVFREWMWTWARRQIIKACITALRSEILNDARSFCPTDAADLALVAADQRRTLSNSTAETLQRRLLKLDVLPRFVFVLRCLEGYSGREIALLLDVDRMTLAAAYKRAAEVIGSSEQAGFQRCAGGASELAGVAVL